MRAHRFRSILALATGLTATIALLPTTSYGAGDPAPAPGSPEYVARDLQNINDAYGRITGPGGQLQNPAYLPALALAGTAPAPTQAPTTNGNGNGNGHGLRPRHSRNGRSIEATVVEREQAAPAAPTDGPTAPPEGLTLVRVDYAMPLFRPGAS